MARIGNTIRNFQERDGCVCRSVGCKVERLRLIYRNRILLVNCCCPCFYRAVMDKFIYMKIRYILADIFESRKEFINVSNFIFITDEITTHENGKEITKPCNSQLETFSPHIADLLIRCCVQIEAISKELYYDNGGSKPRGDKSLFLMRIA